jgi:hypothetical protein
MADLKAQLENALEKAAEYQLLSCLAVDPRRREEYSTRAKFHYSMAGELRTRIATQKAPQSVNGGSARVEGPARMKSHYEAPLSKSEQ